MAVRLIINGETRVFDSPSPKTLQALVAALELNPRQVAVERNGSIVRREQWDESQIQDGDRLEIVQLVGGGAPVSLSRRFSQRVP